MGFALSINEVGGYRVRNTANWSICLSSDGSREFLLGGGKHRVWTVHFIGARQTLKDGLESHDGWEGPWRLSTWEHADEADTLCVDTTPPSSRMTMGSHQAREIVDPVLETWLIAVILDSLGGLRDAQRTSCRHLADVLIARRATRAERRLLTDARQAWPDDSRFAPPDRSEQELDDLLVTVFREEMEDNCAAPSIAGGSPSTRFSAPSASQTTGVSQPADRVAAVALALTPAVEPAPGIGSFGGASALPVRVAESRGRRGGLALRLTWRVVLLSGLLWGAVAFGAAVRDLPWTHSSPKPQTQAPRASALLSTAKSHAQRAASSRTRADGDHKSRHPPQPRASREVPAGPARPELAAEPTIQRSRFPSGTDEPVTSQGGVTAYPSRERHAETAPSTKHAAPGNPSPTEAESHSSNAASGSSTVNVETAVGNTGGSSAGTGGTEQAPGGQSK
jgi:hypothetical protein